MRGAVAAQKLGFFPLYHRAVYRAVWAEPQDLGDEATLRRVLDSVGVPATKLIGRSEEQDIKDELRHNTEHAVQRGVFGRFSSVTRCSGAMTASISLRRRCASWLEPKTRAGN
jgi:2-hydroxychromene-2-carboxylate isomerase